MNNNISNSIRQQPWLHSPLLDSLLIIGPAFIAVICVLVFQKYFMGMEDIPLIAWVLLVLCCDVAHVYATLFRTYLNAEKFNSRRVLLITAPFLAFSGGVFIYSVSAILFWRVLAYVAVFHFIRQQYGFMRLYSRGQPLESSRWQWIDALLVYLACFYPIMYWHTHLPRAFHWFIEGDFVQGLPMWLEPLAFRVYAVCWLLFIFKEAYLLWRGVRFNLPKNLVIFGTALSWYVGIVAFNGDMIFTLTNVVAHGIPYMVLVWIYGRREHKAGSRDTGRFFSLRALPFFIGTLFFLAYIEETLWHGFIWKEYLGFFVLGSWMPLISSHFSLSILVPLLSMPQVTHYILDGYIWRKDG